MHAMPVRMYVCMYVCTNVCTYVCTYIYYGLISPLHCKHMGEENIPSFFTKEVFFVKIFL